MEHAVIARSAPLLRRAPLRRSRFMRSARKSKYRRRERDFPRMLWTKKQPCMVRELPPHDFAATAMSKLLFARDIVLTATPCCGPVEADHMGERGIGQKASDDTVVPMCQRHHRERHDHTGCFRPLNKQELRAWRAGAIARNQAAWRNR